MSINPLRHPTTAKSNDASHVNENENGDDKSRDDENWARMGRRKMDQGKRKLLAAAGEIAAVWIAGNQ